MRLGAAVKGTITTLEVSHLVRSTQSQLYLGLRRPLPNLAGETWQWRNVIQSKKPELSLIV